MIEHTNPQCDIPVQSVGTDQFAEEKFNRMVIIETLKKATHGRTELITFRGLLFFCRDS
jgi:hypothetical protein